MDFKKADVAVLDSGKYKPTKIYKIVCDFIDSEYPIAEVNWAPGEYRNATSAYSSLKSAIVRFKKMNIEVCQRNGKIYLVNKLLVSKIEGRK